MKKMIRITAAIFILVLGIAVALPENDADAYKCIELPEPLDALKEYDTVFAGKVTKIKSEKIRFPGASMLKMHITFDVSRTWQGTQQGTVEISGEPGLLEFKKGKVYLVYARTVDKDHQIFKKGELSTSVCSRTTELSKAGYDLKQLGEGHAPLRNEEMQGDRDQTLIYTIGVLVMAGAVIWLYFKRYKRRRNV